MLNYIITKREPRFEWRFYVEPTIGVEGRVIYKGHKLGVNAEILSKMIELKRERTSDKFYLMDYESNNKWLTTNTSGLFEALSESYDSLQRLAQQKFGKFRKVTISIVNI